MNRLIPLCGLLLITVALCSCAKIGYYQDMRTVEKGPEYGAFSASNFESGEYLCIEDFRISKSAGGIFRKGIWPTWLAVKWAGGKPSEVNEYTLFFVMVEYGNEEDFDQIQAVFRDPLKLDMGQWEEGKPNAFSLNFNPENLPADVNYSCWFGYTESQIVPEVDWDKIDAEGAELPIREISSKVGSQSNGKYLWPISIQKPGSNIYLKVMVLEENAFRNLRKLQKKIGKEGDFELKDLELLVDIVELSDGTVDALLTLAKKGAAMSAKKKIDEIIEGAGPFDIEYFYETADSHAEVPLVHERLYDGNTVFRLEFKPYSNEDVWEKSKMIPEENALSRPTHN